MRKYIKETNILDFKYYLPWGYLTGIVGKEVVDF